MTRNPPAKVCALLAAFLIAVAIGDAVVSTSGLTPTPPPCPVGPSGPDNACLDAYYAVQDQRSGEIDELSGRARIWWLLAGLALAAAAILAKPAAGRARRYFANVGTVGVLAILLGIGAMYLADNVGLNGYGLWYLFPAAGLICVAGGGAVYAAAFASTAPATSPDPAVESPPPSVGAARPGSPAGPGLIWVPIVAFVLVIASIATSISWADAQPACGTGDGTSNPYEGAATVLALIAMAYGVLTLIWRRWGLALFCLVAPVVAAAMASLSGLC